MNRAARRQIQKQLRHQGYSKLEAKQLVEENYRCPLLSVGQKCKLNYELIIRHKLFKDQKDEFKEWIHNHKDTILTVNQVRNNGKEVTFVEDTNETPFWHHTETLVEIATATVKLDNGEQVSVELDNASNIDSSNIQEKINEVLNGEKV